MKDFFENKKDNKQKERYILKNNILSKYNIIKKLSYLKN